MKTNAISVWKEIDLPNKIILLLLIAAYKKQLNLKKNKISKENVKIERTV